jgi:uncharacterized protein (DUF1015 family)
MDYNRVVRSLNGLNATQFLENLNNNGFKVQGKTTLSEAKPNKKHSLSLYLEGMWYSLKIDERIIPKADPVRSLDVQLLNDHVLDPILGIKDLRND